MRPRRRRGDSGRDGRLDHGGDPREPRRPGRRPAAYVVATNSRRSGLIARATLNEAGLRTNSRLEKLADLLVTFGANVQQGQIVELTGDIGKEEMTRAIARRAYEVGAKFVDVSYFDLHVKRARLELAPEETLDFVPAWYGAKVLALGEHRAAAMLLTGPAAPRLLDGIEPARVGRDRLPSVPEWVRVINDRTVNWSLTPCPTAPWAKLVFPDLDDEAALDRLWELVEHVCRLDEDDPVAAWNARMDMLERAGSALTARHFDSLHFEGPGTDLVVGLLPSSRWMTARSETVDGIPHVVNLPSEETFTAPDPLRVDGIARATMPLELSGLIVEGLRIGFEGGRAVQIDADSGAEAVRALTEHDEGAARLGEVALVDREGRVGPLGTVFYDTLLDENAASHVALGNAYAISVADEADRERANDSKIHVDFMIGGDEVAVTGVTATGERVPVLRDGAWQI